MADDKGNKNQRRGGLPGFDLGGSGGGSTPQNDKMRRNRLIIWVIVLGVVGFVLFQTVNPTGQSVPYSDFVGFIKQGPEVLSAVTVTDTSVSGTVTHKDGSTTSVSASRLSSDDTTIKLLLANDIEFDQKPPSGWVFRCAPSSA